MERGGLSHRKIYTMWLRVMGICIISTLVGVVLIEIAPHLTGAYISAAAGGSLLGMLAITMIPEGYQEGGKLTALLVVLGFAFAAMLGVIG